MITSCRNISGPRLESLRGLHLFFPLLFSRHTTFSLYPSLRPCATHQAAVGQDLLMKRGC